MRKPILIFSLFLLYSISCFSQSQPLEPTSGPGGSNYTYGGVTTYDYGTGKNGDGFWIYEPEQPVADSANVVVFCHGWGMTNPKYYGKFIEHIVRKGNIVIYPRYQKDWNTDNATYTDSCARGIQRALDTLAQAAGHVKPRLQNYFVLGHSMGGVLTANMATRYAMYNLPKPLAAFSMQPGADIATLLLTPGEYATFDADIKYLIAIGDNDAVVDSTAGNKLFNQTTAVPTAHKNLVRHFADTYGSPDIAATHAEPGSTSNDFDTGESNPVILVGGTAVTDAVDYYCYWKLWDALMDCALSGQNCDVAFGDTPQQKFMGNWSDGRPVKPLKVTPSVATAIAETALDASVQVYPNPAGNKLFISCNPFNGERMMQLFDLTGTLVGQANLSSNLQQVDLPLTAGIYFYRVQGSNKVTIATGKLVVQ